MGTVAAQRLGIIVVIGVLALAIAFAAFVEASSAIGDEATRLVAPAATEDQVWSA